MHPRDGELHLIAEDLAGGVEAIADEMVAALERRLAAEAVLDEYDERSAR